MKRLLSALPLFALVLALDLLTKYLAASYIDPAEAIEVAPFFRLVNVRNVGAAFGMFQGLGNAVFIAISLAAIALIAFMLAREERGRLGLTLILAGAVGNLTDRLLYGYVRDFLDFHVGTYHWPAFNVADSALTVGLGLVLISSLFKR